METIHTLQQHCQSQPFVYCMGSALGEPDSAGLPRSAQEKRKKAKKRQEIPLGKSGHYTVAQDVSVNYLSYAFLAISLQF